MRRFEFEDGKSHKFWEIEVDGKGFTVRYGRIGTDGRTSEKTFADATKAQSEAEKLIRSKTKKGYVEVGADGEPAPTVKRAGPNPELEAAIHADPDDLDAWRAYGEWLEAEGDPRGELVAIDCALAGKKRSKKLTERRAELLDGYTAQWLGEELAERDEAVLKLEWSFGFLRSARVSASWNDEAGPTVEAMTKTLLKSDVSRFLHELVVGLSQLYDPDFEETTRLVTQLGGPSLRRLVIGDFDRDDTEISWTTVGKVGGVWKALPNLQYLKVRGGGIDLGKVAHDRLEELVIETGGLPGKAARQVAKAQLPSLTSLEVWFGTEHYGGSSSVKDLRPLLRGEGLPELKRLGLQNADFQDDIAKALCDAPIVAQLETLDLSMGTMGEEGAMALVENAEHFRHLKSINLAQNWIGEDAQKALRKAFGKAVQLGFQDFDEEPDYRFVTVGE